MNEDHPQLIGFYVEDYVISNLNKEQETVQLNQQIKSLTKTEHTTGSVGKYPKLEHGTE